MLIVGITGGTGCGKTTIVNQIINELPNEEVGMISQDSYYNDLSHLTLSTRRSTNFDHPDAIDFSLLTKHLKELKAGKSIQQPVYSFLECKRINETVPMHPKKVLFLEGILILTNREIRKMLDIKIFVQTDSDERLIRRLKRDINKRGWNLEDTISNYQTVLKPMHEQFIVPTKKYADIIIPNNNHNTGFIEIVRNIINKKLV